MAVASGLAGLGSVPEVNGRKFTDTGALNAVLDFAPQSGDPEAFVAAAIIESGIRSDAVGDGGNSFGIFQLNRAGRLHRLGGDERRAKQPRENARVSAEEFAEFAAKGLKGAKLALAAQRPSDPEYGAKFAAALPIARELLKMGKVGGGNARQPNVPGAQGKVGGQLTDASLAALEQYLGETEEAVLAGADPGDPFGMLEALKFTPGPPDPNAALKPGHHEHDGHDHGAPAGAPKRGGGYGGTEGAVKSITGNLPRGFVISSEKRNRRNTKSGNMSDHYIGNKTAFARDIAVPGGVPSPAADRLASRIVSSLGGPADWGKRGGNFVKVVNGIRWQVIWRSGVGGNHNDHIHIGAHLA